jgi:hypothetical protein
MLAALLLGGFTAFAADHIDSPGAEADPTADITDVYAWTNTDASKVNLIMNVGPLGSATSFSDAVTYVFQIEATTGYGVAGTSSTISCEFYDGVNIECWGPSVYVVGDASPTTGLANAADSFRVFAGPRNDPFFMDFTGFTDTVDFGVGAGLVANGGTPTCTAVTADTTDIVLATLSNGGVPEDFFAGQTVQSLVVQIDSDLLTENGTQNILAINGATFVKPAN